MSRKPFLDFQVDHMTLLVDPSFYNVAYALFRVVFGVSREDILYEKRKEWAPGQGEQSMTFAARIGRAEKGASEALQNTIVAVVQPTEPEDSPSHVRRMLKEHSAASHWQHIALRTPDLLAFHKHALERGVRFITPILQDEGEDLIQVFSGEWYFPGSEPSGMFFEFVQRNPTPALLQKLKEHNRQSWFRDKTFLGLYGEKEKEYQSGVVTPFIPPELFAALARLVAGKKLWEISDSDMEAAEKVMLEFGRRP